MTAYHAPLEYSPFYRAERSSLSTVQPSLLLAMTEKAGCATLAKDLQQAGYEVHLAPSAYATLALLERAKVDLVLLHTELPDMEIRQLCQRLRTSSRVPVVVVAEQKKELELIDSLSLGADVYIALPITFAELNARLQATLRRAGYGKYVYQSDAVRAAIHFDMRNRKIYINDREVPLTQIEYRIVSLLLYNANTPVTKEQLLEAVWGYGEAQEVNFIEVAIWRLRHKIERNPSKPEYLTTVRGAGYQLNVTPE